MIRLDIAKEKNQTAEITLEGVEYQYHLKYDMEYSSWYFSLYTALGDPLFEGIRLCLNGTPLTKHKKAGMPKGQFIVFQESDDDTQDPPEYYDLGHGVNLYYIPSIAVFDPNSNTQEFVLELVDLDNTVTAPIVLVRTGAVPVPTGTSTPELQSAIITGPFGVGTTEPDLQSVFLDAPSGTGTTEDDLQSIIF